MAVTRSKTLERAEIRRTGRGRQGWRTAEAVWLLAAAVLIAAGLRLVYLAKSHDFTAIDAGIASKQLLNLNTLSAREDLLPVLANIFTEPGEREFAARKIYDDAGALSNTGALARIRVTAAEIRATRGLRAWRDRLGGRESMPLFTPDQFRALKPLVVVRQPHNFRSAFTLWTILFFGAFALVHLFWSLRGFNGEATFLPAILLLTGIGLILMVALRDPVRDNLLFTDFAQGAVIGCLVLAAASVLDFERLAGRLAFVPLLVSFALSVLLILFGTGPGSSDAKVNLFGFQPVELIRLLLVFFLAGYFGSRWDVLRHARETRASLARLTSRLNVPPVEYTLPILAGVLLSLAFFFLQKDMGPALVFACVFLILYAIARGSAFVPVVGLGLLVLGFAIGYMIGIPHTVADRVGMWLSPWSNLVHGGDQLADSLWAFATGGPAGMGIGLGDPQVVPAAHTDLILSALGEEWGFLGVSAVFAVYALIVWRAIRIARSARTDYEMFLAAGLAAATALQILVIAGGALGLMPLTGVVTPFLSYGRTAMIANFLVIGILEAISARGRIAEPRTQFPLTAVAVVFGICGVAILAKAAYVEVLHDSAIVGEGALVVQADGGRRYQYNPRFLEVMRDIPKGTIYDRNGLPLATSDWTQLEKHRADYTALGIDIDRACPRTDQRYYPLGPLAFDLLGDLRTRYRWGAGNTAFVERDEARRLRGYDDRPSLVDVKNPKTGATERVIKYDYRELVPLLRHRYDPENPAVRRVLDRPRDVKMSLDARLQIKVADILKKQLAAANQDKGAAVVMDPATGDLLAAVSLPLPDPNETTPSLDRARYGLYPPGSTFKVVTAMAALRKDASLTTKTYQCIRLPDGRTGNYIRGSNRPIRDDVQDKEPHGTVNMERGIVVSCNAFFAQLGTYDVGAQQLWDTASLLGISAAKSADQLKKYLPQSSYGQGEVVASPFQMARVAATVANGGSMPLGRWITDETNSRTDPPKAVLAPDAAQTLAKFMREVVTSGTGRRAAAGIAVAGKTGTAELASAPSHAWFIGFAPYGGSPTGRKIAFSVLVENGVYGGTAAAPAAAEIVSAAAKLGLVQ